MRNNDDLSVAQVVMSSVFQIFVMAGTVCFLDVMHRHRRSSEVISAAKSYESISDQLSDEQKKELSDSIYHRAEEIMHYKAW